MVKDQSKKEVLIGDANPGTLFGEVALLHDTKRTASIRTKDHCTVGALSELEFVEMLECFPDLGTCMLADTRKYKDHWKV